MSNKKFFISTAIPYVNAYPHIGHAIELVQGDVLARYHRLIGDQVFFLNGTDENALKNVQAAEKAGKQVKEFIDENSQKFIDLSKAFDISNDDFIRTTEDRHIVGSQKLWTLCDKTGDIYKKAYKGLYCIGCESFKTAKDLVDGFCPIHQTKPDEIEEENYFFKLSNYQNKLLELIDSGQLKIIPATRKNEITEFIKQGLDDFSISRSNARAKNWGIPVPGDDSQRMYVWFDALTNYINALGYGADETRFNEWWSSGDTAHLIGKDITRFHVIYWPAMLISAGLPAPKTVYVHGFITVDGQKMSKTIGNVVDPFELIKKYGPEVVRYYLLREIPSDEDGDFSIQNLERRYNSDLANGLGNFTARVLTLAAKETFSGDEKVVEKVESKINETKKVVGEKIQEFKLHEALAPIWELLAFGDAFVNETQAWKREDKNVIFSLVTLLDNAAFLLQPFMPETAEKITKRIVWEGDALVVRPGDVLFPRRT